MSTISTYGALPGISDIRQTTEKVVWWGREVQLLYVSDAFIKSSTVDAGNTPTTTLRAGLILGRKTSDKMLYAWNPDAVDGTENIAGVLLRDISMLDADGVAEDKSGHILRAGPLKVADLLIEGTAFASSTDEYLARRQLVGSGFVLDDESSMKPLGLGAPSNQHLVTGDTTVTAADSGKLFLATTANATFTLPTIEAGLVFEFYRCDNFNLVVAGAANKMIAFNNASATSVAFSTTNEKIGGHFRIQSVNVSGTLKWLASNLSAGANTVTVA